MNNASVINQLQPINSAIHPLSSGVEEEINPENLMKLREVLGIVDREEIHRVLQSYIETIEIMHSYFEDMNTRLKVDYAMSYAINPGWYGSDLLDRVQNIVLLSSLLLVVTGPTFMNPPFDNPDTDDPVYRIFFYLTGLSNLFFLTSICLSVCFIENGMSRGYGKSERLVLTIKQYHLKDISQILVIIGSIVFFPFFLSMTMWNKYETKDANVMIAIVTATSFLCLMSFGYYSSQAGAEQVTRIDVFLTITDKSDGRLLKQYYPEKLHESDGVTYLTPEDYKRMYTDISSFQKKKGGNCLSICRW
jgi:hypothetical protein